MMRTKGSLRWGGVALAVGGCTVYYTESMCTGKRHAEAGLVPRTVARALPRALLRALLRAVVGSHYCTTGSALQWVSVHGACGPSGKRPSALPIAPARGSRRYKSRAVLRTVARAVARALLRAVVGKGSPPRVTPHDVDPCGLQVRDDRSCRGRATRRAGESKT